MKKTILLLSLSLAVASMMPLGAQEPPPAPQDEAPISLFLDSADIHQIIQIIGETLGINYVVDPRIQGTVNINTAGNLQRSDLLPILETILRINGATILQNGNFYEIVPASRRTATGAPRAGRCPTAESRRSVRHPGRSDEVCLCLGNVAVVDSLPQ